MRVKIFIGLDICVNVALVVYQWWTNFSPEVNMDRTRLQLKQLWIPNIYSMRSSDQ